MNYDEFMKKYNELLDKYGKFFKPKGFINLCDFRATIQKEDFD